MEYACIHTYNYLLCMDFNFLFLQPQSQPRSQTSLDYIRKSISISMQTSSLSTVAMEGPFSTGTSTASCAGTFHVLAKYINHNLFFFRFVTSQNNPKTDPVVLW